MGIYLVVKVHSLQFTYFGRVVEDDLKGLASNHIIGWQVHSREVMGEGSCRQNHRPKQ
ncbi:MAG: hypothetical protein V1769_04125 [Thermoplasmatota archaeon]